MRLLLALLALACACKGQPATSEQKQGPAALTAPAKSAPAPGTQAKIGTPLAEPVTLKLRIESGGQNRPTVTGSTNLPDETKLSVAVESHTPGFDGSADAVVRSGEFEAGPFGPDEGLPEGRYKAEVIMPVPQVQPQAVQAVLGTNGEHLQGDLVKREGIGVTVETSLDFIVGGDAQQATRTEQRRFRAQLAEARSIHAEVARLLRQGQGMEALRSTRDTEKQLRQCGEKMRRHQPEAKGLTERAQRLPAELGFHLAVAATNLQLCVSCAEQGGRFCDSVAESMREASAALRSE